MKTHKGKLREKMLDGLTKWLKGGRAIDAPRVTRDRNCHHRLR